MPRVEVLTHSKHAGVFPESLHKDSEIFGEVSELPNFPIDLYTLWWLMATPPYLFLPSTVATDNTL